MITIEEPADDRSLLTLDEIKAAVGETGTSNDVALEALILQVSDMVSDFCGIASDGINPPTLLAEEISETVRLSCQQPALSLARRFVSEIDTVTVAGTELLESEYELDAASGILRYLDSTDSVVAWPAGKTVVVYTAGFAAAPEPVKAAAKELARYVWNAEGANPHLRAETHDGFGSFQYFKATAADTQIYSSVAEMLAPYRSISL